MTKWMDILKNTQAVLSQKYLDGSDSQNKPELISALALSNYLVKSLSGNSPDLKTILRREELKKSVLIESVKKAYKSGDEVPVVNTVGLAVVAKNWQLQANERRDFRFQSLALKNFRKFPEKEMYGLRFCEVGQSPNNLILVGRNSHGKSSLYDAMEYVFTGEVSGAKLRDVACSQFIAHGDSTLESTIRVNLAFLNPPIHSFAEFRMLNEHSVKGCFCSEADVIEIGKMTGGKKSVAGLDFFATNLGYGILVDIKKKLAEAMRKEDVLPMDYENSVENAREDAQHVQADLDQYVSDLFSLWDIHAEGGAPIIRLSTKFLKNTHQLLNESDISFSDVAELLEDIHAKLLDYYGSLHFPVRVDLLEEEISGIKRALYDLQKTSEVSPKIAFLGNSDDMRNELRVILRRISGFVRALNPYKLIDESIVSVFERKILLKQQKTIEVEKREELADTYKKFCGCRLYCNTLDQVLCETLNNQRMSVLKPFVEDAMKLFVGTNKYETVEITDKLEIELKYMEDGKRVTVSPKRYYNTFRYKLFCMMLQISTAVCFMKTHNFVFPLILDDVFYASDFGSRLLIRDFIVHFIQMYESTMGKNSLQLICFTHDEIVLSAIHEALEKMRRSNAGKQQVPDFIFGRLRDYQAVELTSGLYSNLYVELYNN